MKLQGKLLTLVILPVIVCTTIAVVIASIKISTQGKKDLEEKSKTILSLNTRKFLEFHQEGYEIFTDSKEDIESSDDSENYLFRISSLDPENPDYLATKEDAKFIRQFEEHDVEIIKHIDKETNSLWVMSPLYMDKSKGCTDCHESSDNKSRLSDEKDVRGMFLVSSQIEPVQKQVRSAIFQISLAGIIIIIIAIIIGFYVIKGIITVFYRLVNASQKVAKGDLEVSLEVDRKDEIGNMQEATIDLITGLKKTAEFAREIGNANFDHEFEPLSEKDDLGNSLITMRENLQGAAEEEKKRKIEDERLMWTTQGIAKFDDILRKNSDNINELCLILISTLIKYLDANQGGVFILNESDGEKYFDLVASIAYDREKYLEKRIHLSEGIVGRCGYEKETIYMIDIPDEYINITSGLGDANPSALILVPLLLNDELFGVIEVASFNKFEKYQIKFMEKVAESIASTISSVKINMKTEKLLKESEEQAEKMAQQEEEMRQNLEEMKATEEETEKVISNLHDDVKDANKKNEALLQKIEKLEKK